MAYDFQKEIFTCIFAILPLSVSPRVAVDTM